MGHIVGKGLQWLYVVLACLTFVISYSGHRAHSAWDNPFSRFDWEGVSLHLSSLLPQGWSHDLSQSNANTNLPEATREWW